MVVISPLDQDVARVVLDDGRVAIHRSSDDDPEYVARLLHVRSVLGAEYCPAILGDGLEEDAGDIGFRDLVRGRPVPVPLAMRIARAIASAWAMLEERSEAHTALLGQKDLRLGSRLILLVKPAQGRKRYEDPTHCRRPDLQRLHWMAPEVIRGRPCAVSVMFGVGMLLAEALTGTYPFAGTNELELLDKVLEHDLPPLPEIIPAPIARIIERCAQRNPADRFASWSELLAALDDACMMHPVDARPMIRAGAVRIDLRPVTRAEYARFRGSASSDDAPITNVTLDDAKAYARWARKRIPESDEWEAAVRAVGAEALDVGGIWEFANGERVGGGWTVRGGPWRDRRERGQANNLSRSDAAADVGFRCVVDV